jgi:hypothetical protein
MSGPSDEDRSRCPDCLLFAAAFLALLLAVGPILLAAHRIDALVRAERETRQPPSAHCPLAGMAEEKGR